MASKREIEAGKAVVVVGMDSSPLERGCDVVQKKLQSFGQGVAMFGAGIAAAGATITAPFLYGLSVFSEWGKEIQTTSLLTSVGFEAIQGIALGLRTDLEGMTASVGHMNQFLDQLAHGSAEAGRSMLELGLDAEAMLGPMSEEERLRRFSEAIAGVGDAAQRGAAGRHIFGRHAMSMDFSGGVQGLRGREARGREVGGVMSAADGELAKEYNKSLKEMQLSLRGVWASIGAAAAPAMMDFFKLLTKGILAIKGVVDANRPLLAIIFRVADGMAAAGVAIGILGGIIYGAAYAFTFVSGAIAIVSGVLGFIASWAYFAATGFGVLGVATTVWGWATVAASALATAAVFAWGAGYAAASAVIVVASAVFGAGISIAWAALQLLWAALVLVFSGQLAYTVATAVATVAMFLYSAALLAINVALAVFNIDNWIAVIGMVALKGATLAASVATFIYSLFMWDAAAATTVATGGINLLVAALLVAASVLLAVFFAAPFVILGAAIWSGVKALGTLGSAFGDFGGMAGPIGNSWAGVATRIGDSFSAAWERTSAGFMAMASGLLGTATTTFGAIKDAFAIGDWELIWTILKAGGLRAWEDVSYFAVGLFNTWKDALGDAFTDAWAALKSTFIQAWASIKEVFFTVIYALMAAWQTFQNTILNAASDAIPDSMRSATDIRRRNEQRARQATADRVAREPLNSQIQNAQLERTEAQRAERARVAGPSEEVLRLRRERDEARRLGHEERAAELQTDLNALANTAFANMIVGSGNNTEGPEAPEMPPGGYGNVGTMKAFGTFSSNFEGMFGGDTAIDRAHRDAEAIRNAVLQAGNDLGGAIVAALLRVNQVQ